MIAQLSVLMSTSHSFNSTRNQPASCRMTTSLHVPKNTNQHMLETSYNAQYRLHTSNFILAYKAPAIFLLCHIRLSIFPTHVVARSILIRIAIVLSKFGGTHIEDLNPREPPTKMLPNTQWDRQGKEYAYPLW